MTSNACLGEIAEIVMGQSPTSETCNDAGEGIPLLNGPTEFGIKHPSPVQFTTDPKKKSKQGDLLFCVRGSTTGRMNWANREYAIGRGLAAIRGKNGIPNSFIRAVIEANLDALLVKATGSTFPNVSKDLISSLSIPDVTPLFAQNVASIIEPLDDRITLLRETNQTLESIVQTLFKSWFVDFDPVRAKADSRLPEGIDASTAALFPDAFEESELGLVPKGWTEACLSTIATFQNGYAFKGSDWSEVGHPVVKIGNVKPLHIDFDGCSFVSPQTVVGLERFKLGSGDLLVGMTGYVGETGLVPHNDTASYLNQRVGRITTKNGLQDLGFVFSAVRQKEFKIYAESQSHGSAQANVSGADLMKFPVTVPSADILEKYNELTHQFIVSILNNHSVATSLTSLRDILLPRLISGQLRIADAEAELEKATA